MPDPRYDVITVGGGIGSSSLARAMAANGKRVLVLEREPKFRDRVRGEYLSPWGVAEARKLGIYDLVRDACGMDAPWVEMGMGPRNLPASTLQRLPALGFCHPEMQETLITAAEKEGAEVRRGVHVTGITPGLKPTVIVHDNGRTEELATRLVIAADGRTSNARKWGGFSSHERPQPFLFAGLLLSGLKAPEGHAYLIFNPQTAMAAAIAPVGKGRFRTYVAYPTDAPYRLQGPESVPLFIEQARKFPQVAEFFGTAEPIGPLASFSCGDFWVDHPYGNGVALIGDAAGTTDPAFGQGLSLTLRDARVLRDKLAANDDWDSAGHEYATEHDVYSKVARTVSQWYRHLFLEQSPEANKTRAVAFPLIAQDESRIPDHLLSGPELPSDEMVRKRFFGEA